jgi:hypothetical protein
MIEKIENEIKETLHSHYVNDMKKPDVNKELRVKIIENYLAENNINANQYCKKFNIPHTTLVSWMKHDKTTDKYNVTIYVPRDKMRINCLIDNLTEKLNHKCEIDTTTADKLKLLEKAINSFRFRHKI